MAAARDQGSAVPFKGSMDTYLARSAAKAESPAAERNKAHILGVLSGYLGEADATANNMVWEIASGSGQHVAFFAAGLPHLTFQPTDVTPGACNHVEDL